MAKRAFVRRGDCTTHGGTVLTGDPTFLVLGREVARVGDSVSCPRCKRTSLIATGAPTMFGGQLVARHDDVTDCGARLIASQFTDTYEDGSESQASQTLAAKPAAEYADETSAVEEPHAIRFQTIDAATGQPIPESVYILTHENGTQHGGMTDEEGFTEVIEAMHPEQVAVHFMFKSAKGENIEREDLAV